MHTVDLSGGTIHYETAGPPTGRPVVFIHGYAMGGSLWRPLSARLARHGLRCIVPTWPLGAHQEAMRPSADMTMRGVAAMVAEFLDAVGLDDVVLVGNDTGGAVAQVVATEFPDRLGALVLTSCDAFEHFPPPILAPFIAAAKVPAAVPHRGAGDALAGGPSSRVRRTGPQQSRCADRRMDPPGRPRPCDRRESAPLHRIADTARPPSTPPRGCRSSPSRR